MADRIITQVVVNVSANLRISEAEMRALDALFGYGVAPLLKVFYEHLGSHYMKPHEAGLESLAEVVRDEIPALLRKADASRLAFNGGLSRREKELEYAATRAKERYEFIRTLNAEEFSKLFSRNVAGEKFDHMVDQEIQNLKEKKA